MTSNTQSAYAEQLSKFASELRNHVDDEAMLQEIHEAIKVMLSGNDFSEREIRDVLQNHFAAGDLREESFQLVQQLIDNIVTEELPTTLNPEPEEGDDQYSSTTVIPTVTLSPAMADQNLQVGSVLRDRFLLTEEVPGGSMGAVYKAIDRRLAEAGEAEHFVAIKVLSPKLSYDADALRALQQEAVKTRCLSHPNIVRFVDLDRDDDLYFMVMEWLEGRSLASILDDSANHQIDLDTALDIVTQIGHALDYAHLRGVVHADVKPGNIMITPNGQAKLFDFGIARIRQKQNETRTALVPSTLQAATPAYSSMQVLTGEEPVAADDVFSLGCLAYRLIAGYRVFGPRNAAEAAEAGMEPQRLENLDKQQWQALKKALAYSRVARYSSPALFVKALQAVNKKVLQDIELPEAQNDTFVDAFDTERRKPWRYVALALIFIAAGAVVFENELVQIIRPYFNETAAPIPTNSIAAPATTESSVPGGAAADTVAQETLAEKAEDPVSEPVAEDVAPPVVAESTVVADPKSAVVVAQTVEPLVSVPVAAQPPVDDFSGLPPANIILPLAGPGDQPGTSGITLVEGGMVAIIDFVRDAHLEEVLQLQLVEKSFSSNQSPLQDGQYEISNDGILDFPRGQHRARVTLAMTSDSLRESDHQVLLSVVDTQYGDFEFASIRLTLQDDDQRAFESRLPPNTVAFAEAKVHVRERDAAVHVDVIRFKADDTELEVDYRITDLSTSEGEDYIAPHNGTLFFGPSQRLARLLIPVVQDSVREADETFVIDLIGEHTDTEDNIYRRIEVMIQDDDT